MLRRNFCVGEGRSQYHRIRICQGWRRLQPYTTDPEIASATLAECTPAWVILELNSCLASAAAGSWCDTCSANNCASTWNF